MSNWRMIRSRLAPSAARTAISRVRAIAWLSNNVVVLAQAISNTIRHAHSSKLSLTLPTRRSCSRTALTPPRCFGYTCSSAAAMAVSSA